MGEPTTAGAAPRRRWRRWLLEATVLVGILFAIRGYQASGLASGAAPPIDGVDLAGQPVGAGGRPVLVHFMASWCGVCRAEEGSVAAVARDHDVIAIATQSGDDAQVRAWIERTELDSVTVVADPRGEIARAWGVGAFPTSFYVDAAGDIRHVEVGFTSELGMRLRMWLSAR